MREREGRKMVNFPLKKLKTVAAEEFRHKILSDEFKLYLFVPSLNLNFGSGHIFRYSSFIFMNLFPVCIYSKI